MAFEPIFPIEGNLLNEPELRFTPNGVAVCNFRVGINDARAEQNNGKKVPPLIAEIAVWRDMAEHCAETFIKGTRITAKVRMTELGAYIPRNGGDPVGTLKVEALEIGPSMRWAKGDITKVAGGGQKSQNQGDGNQQGQQGGWGQNPNQGGSNQGQGGGWGNPGGNQGADPWSGGQHPGQQGGGGQQDQGGGWGSNQSWGNPGGNQGDNAWGQQG